VYEDAVQVEAAMVVEVVVTAMAGVTQASRHL
jgi:hypothetical protein